MKNGIVILLCIFKSTVHMGRDARKPVFGGGFAKNKDADQPAHLHSLISAFVIPILESIISRLATSEILFC